MSGVNVIESVDYDYYDPDGKWTFGYEKIEEPAGSPLWEGVRRLIARSKGIKGFELTDLKATPRGPLHLTVHHSWSGYSEYTITNTWDEITVEWDDFKQHFDHMSLFFRAVFEADLSYDDETRWDMERDEKYGPIAKGLR